MAVGQVVHDLAHRPAAGPVGRVELLAAKGPATASRKRFGRGRNLREWPSARSAGVSASRNVLCRSGNADPSNSTWRHRRTNNASVSRLASLAAAISTIRTGPEYADTGVRAAGL